MHADSIRTRCPRLCSALIILLLAFASLPADAQRARFWGSLSSIYSEQTELQSNFTSTNWLNIVTFNAGTYIWQPWFALISGSVSISQTETENNQTVLSTDNETLAGSFQFDLFPTSRFPFTLYASRSELQQDNSSNDGLFTQETFGLKQRYTSVDGKQLYSASFEQQKRNKQDGSVVERQDLDLGATLRFEHHDFISNISHAETFEANRTDRSDSAVSVTHRYSGVPSLSLVSQVSAAELDDQFSTNSTTLDSRQFSSTAIWSPRDLRDLRVNGNFRIFERDREQINAFNLTATRTRLEQTTMSLSQGLTYRFTDNLTASQSANVTQSESAGVRTEAFSEGAGLTYSSDLVNLSFGDYSWFASSNLSNQHGDIRSNTSLTNQAGHTLRKTIVINPDFSLDTNFGQNLSYSSSNNARDSGAIGHSASVGWSDSAPLMNTRVLLSMTDSRDLKNDDSNQLVTLQFTQVSQLDRSSTLNADIRLQRARATTGSGETDARLTTARVSYADNRFLNTPGLIFRSSLNVSDLEPENTDAVNPTREESNDASWENELRYRIGLFESRLSFDYIRSNGQENQIIIIEFTRHFGDL